MSEEIFKPISGHFNVTYEDVVIHLVIDSGGVSQGAELLETFRVANVSPNTLETAIISLLHQQQKEKTRSRWNEDNRAVADSETRQRYPLLSSLLPENILAAGQIGITIRRLSRLHFNLEKLADTDDHQLRAKAIAEQRLPIAVALRELAKHKLSTQSLPPSPLP